MDVVDVGELPVLPPPRAGDRLTLRLPGSPPEKTFSRSMRNATSTQRPRFMALRRAAASAMGGPKWYEGPVGIALTYWVNTDLDRRNRRYLDGVMDTLGGATDGVSISPSCTSTTVRCPRPPSADEPVRANGTSSSSSFSRCPWSSPRRIPGVRSRDEGLAVLKRALCGEVFQNLSSSANGVLSAQAALATRSDSAVSPPRGSDGLDGECRAGCDYSDGPRPT